MALSISEEMTQQTGESLDARQKEASDDVDWTLVGKVFQARAAATGNARSPRVDRRWYYWREVQYKLTYLQTDCSQV